jgi:DNA-binding PadR family transcriptional regulator
MGNLYRFVEPVVLFLLKTKGETYGYELQKGLREHALSDSVIEGGALYRTLRRLEDAGYVTSSWDTSGGGPARRQYKLTADGEKHLQEWAAVLKNLSASMSKFVNDVEETLSTGDTDKE